MATVGCRQQQTITVRSDRAAARLALLTRAGRSQVDVIEEALERMPLPPQGDVEGCRARIDAILQSVPARAYPTMAEVDAGSYHDHGLSR